MTYDVVCLLNTFTPIIADGSTDPSANFRGTTFFVEGDRGLDQGNAIGAAVNALPLRG